VDIHIATRSLQEDLINRLIMDTTHFTNLIKMSANLVIIENTECKLFLLITFFNS